MKNFIDTLNRILVSSRAKTFYWQTVNGLIGLLIMSFSDLNLAHGALIVSLLNMVTKYINVTFLKK